MGFSGRGSRQEVGHVSKAASMMSRSAASRSAVNASVESDADTSQRCAIKDAGRRRRAASMDHSVTVIDAAGPSDEERLVRRGTPHGSERFGGV